MVADLGIAITQGLLVALAKHCRDACAAAKRYPEESARIRLRLTYLLSSVPEWSSRIGTSTNDVGDDNDDDTGGCSQLGRSLYDSLSDLTLCVQALGCVDDKSWRRKIKIFLQGRLLLDKLNEAEAKFNQVLDDLNHDSTNFIALQLPTIQDQLSRVNNIEAKLSCMLSLFTQFDQMLAGNTNQNDQTPTLNDAIEKNLDEFHKRDTITDTYSSMVMSSSVDTTVDLITINRGHIIYDASALETRLGKGGFAEVFKGSYNKDEVAVKVIDIYRNYDRLDEMPLVIYQEECNRVQDEAMLMKQCSIHSNVVDVYGYCPPQISGSKPLIVMELMYASLNKILHQRTDLDISFNCRLQLMKDIAKAVEFLHLQGIVHQDIKATNILVDEWITVAKLTDFGVAECKGFKTTWTQRHTTALATVLKNSKKHAAGTLAYQAPELVLGQVTIASRSADMYSLGVTIWECLSRTIPHHNEATKIILLAHNKNKPMMMFPVKDAIVDTINMMPNECDAFSLLEKVSLMCTSRDPPSRPTATNIVHYLAGTSAISHSFPIQYLSHWSIDVDDWPVHIKNDPRDVVSPPTLIGVGTEMDKKMEFDNKVLSEVVNSNVMSANDNLTDSFNSKPIQSTSSNIPSNIEPVHIGSGFNSTTNMAGQEGKVYSSMMRKLVVVALVLVIIVAVVVYLVTKKNHDPTRPTTPTPTASSTEGPVPSPTPFKSGTFNRKTLFV
jgi:serine/threonine protein kinase